MNLRNLYKLPWLTYNNPNGWIEPTTYCQLACPGCYRGLDQPNAPRIHGDINKLKKEIETLIKIRSIETLSIAGGEPLLYPKLNELITYAHKKGLKVKIVTNGWALTKSKLKELKKIGTSEIVIHLASYQKRGGYLNEDRLDELRKEYCQMFREVKGINLQFIMTVYPGNIKNLPRIINFYKRNSDIVNHFIFTNFQTLFPEKELKKKKKIKIDEIRQKIENEYKIKPCAYLPKTLSPKSVSWLFYVPIFHGKEIIGYADGKIIEKLFKIPKRTNNEEIFPIEENTVRVAKAINLLLEPMIRKILWRYLFNVFKNPINIFKSLKYQIIIIINTPDLTDKGWSLCDGCPDAMIYKEVLVPSCALERIKLGEKIEL